MRQLAGLEINGLADDSERDVELISRLDSLTCW